MKKLILGGVIVLAIGAGVYFYFLKKKKAVNPGGPEGIMGVNGGGVPSANVPGAGAVDAPSEEEILKAAGEFYQQQVQKKFADAPVPIPGDLTSIEMQNLENFCSLKVGAQRLYESSGGISYGMKLGSINYRVSEQYGLSNILYDRSGYAGSRDAYFKSLKLYKGC